MKVKVGCCGFPVSMKKYREKLKLVEIQKTFYKLPSIETAEKWREEFGKGFEFVLKVPQLITHPPSSPTYRKAGIEIPEEKKNSYGFFRPTDEVLEVFDKTKEFAKRLNSKILLFQTPRSFSQDMKENIFSFFEKVRREDFVIAWEPRGWDARSILEVVRSLDIVHSVDPFKSKPLYGSLIYYRLHGRGTGYRYDYSDEELRDLLSFLSKDKENYILFNNTEMWKNSLRFAEFLKDELFF